MCFKKTSIISVATIFLLIGLFYFSGNTFSRDIIFDNYRFKVDSLDKVISLFPTSVETIQKQKDKIFESSKKEIEKIIALENNKRNFDNTVVAVDKVLNDFSTLQGILYTISSIHPDKKMRDTALNIVVEIGKLTLDVVMGNKELYKAFEYYVDNKADNEKLDKGQKYFLKEMMDRFERVGFGLSEKNYEKVQDLHKEILSLNAKFQKNINSDNRSILVTDSQLEGLPKDFIEDLKKNKDGLRVVGIDYPTYFKVMKNCSNSEIRKKLYEQFLNRGYPKNAVLLKKIIKKRDQLAKLLDYDSYANFDCSDQMICTAENAEKFVWDLFQTADKKAKKEFNTFISSLDDEIQMKKDKKLYPWDIFYIKESYRKKNYDLDETKISEYLPLNKTLEVLEKICERLFNISLQEVSNKGLWHQDVKVLKVVRLSDNFILGYMIMDLHPRKDKFPHACAIPVFAGLIDGHGNRSSAVVSIVANFPKPTDKKPSLLTTENIRTFFHEVGHGLHGIFGATKFATFAGTNTKTDFVELPSQLMEIFVWEPEILKQLSCHYKTGDPLPKELIEKMIALKNFDYGSQVQAQLYYAMVSIGMFKEGQDKDPKKVVKDLHKKMLKNIAYADFTNMYSAFMHLTDYGAKYYGYMFSRVLALDVYDVIKKHGLLNPKIGQKYIDTILSRGGSLDPNILIKDFLGRDPNNKAYIEYYGFA